MLNKVKSLSSASGMLYYHQIRIMKWMSNKYAYPLVALAVLASVGLQSAWLGQLFRVQQVQVKRDLEQAVNMPPG
jgi:hypothetical protein